MCSQAETFSGRALPPSRRRPAPDSCASMPVLVEHKISSPPPSEARNSRLRTMILPCIAEDDLASFLNSRDDAVVSSAAADISFEPLFDLCFSSGRILAQQSDAAENH